MSDTAWTAAVDDMRTVGDEFGTGVVGDQPLCLKFNVALQPPRPQFEQAGVGCAEGEEAELP